MLDLALIWSFVVGCIVVASVCIELLVPSDYPRLPLRIHSPRELEIGGPVFLARLRAAASREPVVRSRHGTPNLIQKISDPESNHDRPCRP